MRKALVLLTIFLLTLAGCTLRGAEVKNVVNGEMEDTTQPGDAEDSRDSTWLTLYLIQGKKLVPISVRREQPNTFLAREALDAMLEWNSPEWAVSPLPSTTVIKDVWLDGETAVVDFGRETVKGFEAELEAEALLVKSLALTLTELQGISAVRFLVEGEQQEAVFGKINTANDLKRPRAINPEQPLVDEQSRYIRLWFSDPRGMLLIPVERAVKAEEANYKNALNELLEGPQPSSELLPVFPSGTKILGVETEGTTCIVNFSRELVEDNPLGTAGERRILDALILTLTEFPGISQVKILIEGENPGIVFGDVNTAEPLSRVLPNIFE